MMLGNGAQRLRVMCEHAAGHIAEVLPPPEFRPYEAACLCSEKRHTLSLAKLVPRLELPAHRGAAVLQQRPHHVCPYARKRSCENVGAGFVKSIPTCVDRTRKGTISARWQQNTCLEHAALQLRCIVRGYWERCCARRQQHGRAVSARSACAVADDGAAALICAVCNCLGQCAIAAASAFGAACVPGCEASERDGHSDDVRSSSHSP